MYQLLAMKSAFVPVVKSDHQFQKDGLLRLIIALDTATNNLVNLQNKDMLVLGKVLSMRVLPRRAA